MAYPPKASIEARIATAVLVLAAVTAYSRLFLGVDLTDEAFYNSVPYSFVLGMTPYREELNVTQNAGILLWPFYKLYHLIVGSACGVVLFNRHLYFALMTGCALTAYRASRALAGFVVGRLLAAFVLGFSHFNIPSLSYNTIGGLCLFIGSTLLLPTAAAVGSETRLRPRTAGAACLCFTLATFAYPSLIMASLLGFASTWWLAWRVSGRHWCTAHTAVLCAVGFAAFAVIIFVKLVTVDGILESLAYGTSYAFSVDELGVRLRSVLLNQLRHLSYFAIPFTPALLVWMTMLKAARAPRRRTVLLLALLLILLSVTLNAPNILSLYPTGSFPFVIMLGLSLPLALLMMPSKELMIRLAIVAGAPAFAAAISAMISSTNVLQASTLGLFPAAFCFLLALAVRANSEDERRAEDGRRQFCWEVATFIFIGIQSVSLLSRTYRDNPFIEGTPTLASGPYAGLITNQARAEQVQAYRRVLSAVATPDQGLFAYDDIPAAYLFTEMRPRTFSTWIFWSQDDPANRERLKRSFGPSIKWPGVILRKVGSRPLSQLGLPAGSYSEVHMSEPTGFHLYTLKMPITPLAPEDSPSSSLRNQ